VEVSLEPQKVQISFLELMNEIQDAHNRLLKIAYLSEEEIAYQWNASEALRMVDDWQRHKHDVPSSLSRLEFVEIQRV